MRWWLQVLWRAVEHIIPDIRQRCEVTMVGTPLTHKRFLRRHKGSYGPGPLQNAIDIAHDNTFLSVIAFVHHVSCAWPAAVMCRAVHVLAHHHRRSEHVLCASGPMMSMLSVQA